MNRNRNQVSMPKWAARKITEMMKSYVKYYTFKDRDDYYFYTGSTVAHLITILACLLMGLFTGVYALLWVGVLSMLAGVYFWVRSEYRKEMERKQGAEE